MTGTARTRTTRAANTKPIESTEDLQEEVPVDEKMVKLTYEGRVYDVIVREIDGRNIVQESVYKEVPLPYSKRTTKILVAAAGTQIR